MLCHGHPPPLGQLTLTPSLLLPEQKRDVYDRYGKEGLMGAGEWADQGYGVRGQCGSGYSLVWRPSCGAAHTGAPASSQPCVSFLQQGQGAPEPMLGLLNSPSPSAALTMFSGTSLAGEIPLLTSLVRVGWEGTRGQLWGIISLPWG